MGVTNFLLDILGNVLLDVVCEDGSLGYSTGVILAAGGKWGGGGDGGEA